MESIFKVNGKTFFPIGSESRNSSAYTPEETKKFWDALDIIGGNTAEIPIYWDKIEPEEGEFDFTIIDNLIKTARERRKKLIILWFATWKNGVMKYVPSWVKNNTERFKRVITHDGASLFVLSTHCAENLNADCKAFRAVMRHIHDTDDTERTVIGIQVENEPGIVGRSYRDHGPEAEREYLDLVPSYLVDEIVKKSNGPAYEIWKKNGSKSSGNWPELFGREASEFLSAYSVAKFVDTVAGEGKKIHNIPMFVNVWLDKIKWELPGVDYPSGAPEEKVLDIWKWTIKYIDLISPDLHMENTKMYCCHCSVYDREDNALLVPESSACNIANSVNMFYAIGKYHAIGYFGFGIENILLNDGTINPASQSFIGTVKALSAGLPLITKYRNTGKIYPIVQEENMYEQQLRDMEEYDGLVVFDPLGCIDYHHSEYEDFRGFKGVKHMSKERGRGLVIQTNKDEFYVLGAGFVLYLREKHYDIDYAEEKLNNIISPGSIEEGHFDADENWVCDRIRNGDESDGIWIFPDCGVVRVVMSR